MNCHQPQEIMYSSDSITNDIESPLVVPMYDAEKVDEEMSRILSNSKYRRSQNILAIILSLVSLVGISLLILLNTSYGDLVHHLLNHPVDTTNRILLGQGVGTSEILVPRYVELNQVIELENQYKPDRGDIFFSSYFNNIDDVVVYTNYDSQERREEDEGSQVLKRPGPKLPNIDLQNSEEDFFSPYYKNIDDAFEIPMPTGGDSFIPNFDEKYYDQTEKDNFP
jgi:hypothetical protein